MTDTTKLKLEDLTLTKVNEVQWRLIQEHHAGTWGGGVSVKDYQKRKTLLCQDSEFSKKGRFTGWALVPKNDIETVTHLVSFCDTYERPIFIKDEAYPHGREMLCTCVVSVVVHTSVSELLYHDLPRLTCMIRESRGRGYAKRMLELLHDEMAKTSIMSILYSDIGDWYSKVKRQHVDENKRVGWKSMSSKHVIWDVDIANNPPDQPNQIQVIKLEHGDIAEVCKFDAELLKREVLNSKSQAAFTVLPTDDQYDWQFRRTRFFDDLRHPPSRYSYPKISDIGCQIGHPGDEDWAFAIWHFDVILNELNILRLRCSNTEQLRAIVQQAQRAAREQGMITITAWSVAEKLLEGTGWKNVERKDHMPALAWYGDGELPEWVCNENWIRC